MCPLAGESWPHSDANLRGYLASVAKAERAAGFTGIAITSTYEAGPGLHSAIIKAAKPAGRQT
jgi:hypothetical protein